MHKFLMSLLLCLSVSLFAQVDTAQVVIPNRKNAPETLNKPYVILISADGFRYDYAKKFNAKHLLKLGENGVSAKAMIPGYPSITFPNHWSLITGLHPAHHGLVDNFFYDYSRNKPYLMSNREISEDGSWYGGTPLWSLAEKQGMLAASMMWVGSASDAGGVRPTYYYHYHEKFSSDEKVAKVVSWLKLPEEVRPHFISMYFSEVDGSGHNFGTESDNTEKAVKLVDDAVGNLVQKVNALGLKNVNFIFVSDHGMLNVDGKNPLEIPQILFNKERFDFVNSQTLLRVVVKNPAEVQSVYDELKRNKTAGYQVYLTKKFPRKLKYSLRDDRYNRIGQILLVPNAPKIFLEKGAKPAIGKHGYNPYLVPEMKSTFIAYGDNIQNKKEINEFRNVNVYPVVSKILGLKISEPIDGKSCVARKILKK